MGEKGNALVSVVMPAFNTGKYIATAIDSVLAQTYERWELIVIDDCSADATARIVQDYAKRDKRVSYYRQPANMGVAHARNRGMTLANGEYIAFLDSDDIWLPDKLSLQLSLAERTGAELIYSSYAIIDGNGHRTFRDYIVPDRVSFEELLKENVIGCSTVMVSASVVKRFCFQPACYHEDYMMWLKILQSCSQARGCTQVLSCWRYAHGSRSFNKVKSGIHRWLVYRRYLRLSLLVSVKYFLFYMFTGFRKYIGR